MNSLRTVLIGGLLLAGWVGLVAAETTLSLAGAPPTVRVRPGEAFQGAAAVHIGSARGEYESFQVVVTAVGGNVRGVQAEVSPLTNADGAVLPAEGVVLYREVYVPVRYSSPRATRAPGWIADPLVPFKNPYTGEAIQGPRWEGNQRVGARFGGGGFDVWQDQHQPLWVDVHVPAEAAAGTYAGTVKVSAQDAAAVEIPIEVVVWDFVLPAGPTHENHFGGVTRVAAYHKLDPNSEAFYTLEDRYIQMMADHRINPPLPDRFRPKPGETGAIVVDEALDQKISEFVARYHVTNLEVSRAPFGDPLGADREKALNYYRSWYAYLESKGWAARAYLYMLDEPNDSDAYERVRQLGALAKEASPLRRLVVEQPYTQKPDWGVLDGAIDIWCPLFGFVHEPSVQRVLAQGDEVWSYSALVQKAPPYDPEYEQVKNEDPPYWEIDFPVASYRVAAWLNRRYNITGLLYWSTVYWGSPDRDPWDDPGFRIRFNGDGFLFYPGDDASIDGPVASIRLKNLRDGLEDYEYFALLDNLGARDVVDEIVRQAVPTWGTWNQDPMALPQLRERLAEEIVKRR